MQHLQYDQPRRQKRVADVLFIYALLIMVFAAGIGLGLFFGMLIFKPTPQPVITWESTPVVAPTVIEESYVPEPVYNFTDDEIYLMAQLLCGQGGVDGDGEYDFESQIASGQINWFEINKVLEVVMNRVLTPGIYSDNVTDVIMQKGAFTVMPKNSYKNPSPEVISTVKHWCDAFNSPEYVPSIPDDHYWFTGSRGGGNITRDHF